MPIRLTVGGKVVGDDFFDRADLLDRLWARLPDQSVELIAPRRFGKTSIMQHMLDRSRHGCRVDFIDCEAFHDLHVLLSEISDALLRGDAPRQAKRHAGAAWSGVRGYLGRIRHIAIGTEVGLDLTDPQSPRWSSSIRQLLDAARSRPAPTIVILDEFSMMIDNFMRTKLDTNLVVNFLTWFRRLRQEQGNHTVLAFVVGGSMNLEYWLRRLSVTGTMNDVHREAVPPFDPPTGFQFVTSLLESEHLQWEPGVIEAILEHVEPAVPFRIQALVWLVSQEPGRTRKITVKDVKEAYSHRLIGNAGRHFFQSYEERLNRDDPAVRRGVRRILAHLANSSPGSPVTRSSLEAAFAQASGISSLDDFDAVFADLESEFYIQFEADSQRCFFAHKVLRDWWLRWHPGAVRTTASKEPTNAD